jgi:hypothetical protein
MGPSQWRPVNFYNIEELRGTNIGIMEENILM